MFIRTDVPRNKCQFCNSKKNVYEFIPGGKMCNVCKKNLDKIRKFGLGISTPRITKEMHQIGQK